MWVSLGLAGCIYVFLHILNPDGAGSIQYKQYKVIEWYKNRKNTDLDA